MKVINTEDLKSSQRKKDRIPLKERGVYRDVTHHKVQDSEGYGETGGRLKLGSRGICAQTFRTQEE